MSCSTNSVTTDLPLPAYLAFTFVSALSVSKCLCLPVWKKLIRKSAPQLVLIGAFAGGLSRKHRVNACGDETVLAPCRCLPAALLASGTRWRAVGRHQEHASHIPEIAFLCGKWRWVFLQQRANCSQYSPVRNSRDCLQIAPVITLTIIQLRYKKPARTVTLYSVSITFNDDEQ